MSGGADRGDDLVAELFQATAGGRGPNALDPFAEPPPMPRRTPTPKASKPAPTPSAAAPVDEIAPASVPVIPALAERFDGTYGTVAALSMRIESLASALN